MEFRWPWVMRPHQRAVLESPARFLVLVGGRKSGKTVLALTWLVGEAVRSGGPCYYVAPTRGQARDVAWEVLLRALSQAPRGFVAEVREVDLEARLGNGGSIRLYGAEAYDRMRGLNPAAVVLDEYASIDPRAWELVLRPALSATGGRALFIGTPAGLGPFWALFRAARDLPDWRTWQVSTAEAGLVPAAELQSARQLLPAWAWRQEYEASFEHQAGRVFASFKAAAPYVLSEVPSPDVCRERLGGVDWGYAHAGVMLVVLVDNQGRYWIVDERVERGATVTDDGWLRVARELQARWRPTVWYADPSRPDGIKLLRAATGAHVRAPHSDHERDVLAGIGRLQALLLPPADPRLRVHERCRFVIAALEQAAWDQRASGDHERVKAVGEVVDVLDALRYAVATHALAWRQQSWGGGLTGRPVAR